MDIEKEIREVMNQFRGNESFMGRHIKEMIIRILKLKDTQTTNKIREAYNEGFEEGARVTGDDMATQ